jgi:indolepyruvate ferredoxin oxidoreductase
MSTTLPTGLFEDVTLDDKWSKSSGRIIISGTQAIARILLAQHELDSAADLHTAGYISGYRGSPLGGVDMGLWSTANRLRGANVTFAPGVNEDLAATAVRGTQQIDFVPGARFDGVFAA